MNRIIPILPCPNIKDQTEFFKYLGFELIEIYTSPNPYAVMKYDTLILHFYGSKKIIPNENATMCFFEVDDVDQIYDVFSKGLKKNMGRIPRTGVPRISKVRDLKYDRRFTLTDTGGNTFYIGTPQTSEKDTFFRTIENEENAKKFEILYDLLYSSEDYNKAEKVLVNLLKVKMDLNDLDRAKLLLIELEIKLKLSNIRSDEELKSIMSGKDGPHWEKIKQKYDEILKEL